MTAMRWLALTATLVLAAPARADDAVPEPAPPPPRPTPFDRGKFGLSLGAGRQNELDASYIFVAGGLGYYILDGVQIGLAGEHFFGNGPSISLATPSLRYVAQPLVGKFPLIPYIGAFYDHYFIGGRPDQDGVGGRAGVLYVSGQMVLGLGIAVERTVSTCAKDCTAVFPDITIGLSL